MSLRACPACRRHVRAAPSCPFCSAELPALSERVPPSVRAARAVLLAGALGGATFALAACEKASDPPPQVAPPGSGAPSADAPPAQTPPPPTAVAMYGAAPPPQVAPTSTTPSAVSMYGAPPVPR